MNVYETKSIAERITGNPYVGRGIVIGLTPDRRNACAAYFIMGRSANSRNRIFAPEDGALFTKPFDEEKVEDPSLIIYAAVRSFENHLIVTNGDQTDTIVQGLAEGKSFAEALKVREFEPDVPNYTPRISGILHFDADAFSYQMNILKAGDKEGTVCNRYTYDYEPVPGLGHFIHTYVTDGNPLPTFTGEPERVLIPDHIDEMTDELWGALNTDNKISLYVRYTDLETGKISERLLNRYTKGEN